MSSTSVASVGYDGHDHVLEIEFRNGSVYQYDEVPMPVYHDLLESAAPGVYLNVNVKLAGYPYRRIT